MQYKDLIYKITSSKPTEVNPNEMKKEQTIDVNPAKQSVQPKDLLIGIIFGDDVVLNKGISEAIQKEIDRTLTVLFNSPISDSFSFLPYDKNTLIAMIDLFPEKKFHYLVTKTESEELSILKKDKLNLKVLTNSENTKSDFFNKIDYLVTINVDVLESGIQSLLNQRNITVFPLTFRGTKSHQQPEKLVQPDPSGWVYNKANGLWTKSWGWDGYQELPSWSAPSDWNLSNNPK